eukprot:1039349-Pleurochrysis_carterae.AAC.1
MKAPSGSAAPSQWRRGAHFDNRDGFPLNLTGEPGANFQREQVSTKLLAELYQIILDSEL